MKKLTIAEIEKNLSQIEHEDDPFISMVQNDGRKGVQQAYSRWKKQRAEEEIRRQKFIEMSQYERKLFEQGYSFIAGIDEVGRGPLAGPVVAAAVILPKDFLLPGIDDSKKLSEAKREAFYEAIRSEATAVSVAMISAEEIDEINIYEATKKAMLAAVASLRPAPEYLLIDAMKLTTPYPYEAIIGGDGKSVSIAAASIIAKVTRDRYMKDLDAKYPQYGFAKNMGYGTKEHLTAIETYGITPYHRKSFAPVKDYIHAEQS